MKLSELFSDAGDSLRGLLEATHRAAEGLRPNAIQKIIDDETEIFGQGTQITVRNKIPHTKEIPIENPRLWFRIPDVVSCFVDMEGSTQLSATTHDKSTAKIYRYFTNTAIRIFHEFGSPYIDVKGDGVFALFDHDNVYTALAATVSVKTFVKNEFTPKIENKTGLEIGGHFGMDQRTVLVRKMGLKYVSGARDRQNEVWAGKPVNMAAKLAGRSTDNTLWVSDRYYGRLNDPKATMSCGCSADDGQPQPLWRKQDLSDDERFDFDEAWVLESNWCKTHGKGYCRDLVKLDE